jgi:hypothetical protein
MLDRQIMLNHLSCSSASQSGNNRLIGQELAIDMLIRKSDTIQLLPDPWFDRHSRIYRMYYIEHTAGSF